MKTVLVTGAGGQLGRELQRLAAGHHFVFTTREQLEVDDPEQVQAVFADVKPDWCVNCAAYTAVDKAESEPETAFRINGDAPGFLAKACRAAGTRLIHISTDYVFDGSRNIPLKEDDPTGPINVYGASKLEGEKQVLREYSEGALIIRTSWVYSEFGNNFVKTMIRLMNERPAIGVVDDQVGTPTYAADLAAAILMILSARKFLPGIYHYSNEGQISWYQFALAIRFLIDSPCKVSPIPTTQFPTPARRPAWSLMDKTLIRDSYGVPILAWERSLAACINRLQKA
ncbi:MAG TPA: dTDP-4-dehydrorhamnose reductase [Puia sp.]|jgi:dTDP-4-dehydrorhamnose reductase|nr:dTDP-4-dehydrorhamnose reductase [Puia sp.]